MSVSGKALMRALARENMNMADLARSVDVTPPAVGYWVKNGVPEHRIEEIEEVLGRFGRDASESTEETADSLIGGLDEHKVPLRNKAKKSLRGKPGIYFLCGRNGLPLYIGTSGDMHQRVVRDHSQKSWYDLGVKEVRCIEIGDENLRKALEPMLIYLFNPPFNTNNVPD